MTRQTRLAIAGRDIATWRPGRGETRDTPTDLVREFMAQTASLPRAEVAALAGIGTVALGRWERGVVRRLHPAVQRRLRIHLASLALRARGAGAAPSDAPPAPAAGP